MPAIHRKSPPFVAVASTSVVLLFAAVATADPCGMVPPVYTGPGIPITRIGDQQTYIAYRDGIETMVLRPGFSGKVEEFGMLIPFPHPPAVRKVSDDIFPHIAAAIDPPEVVVYVQRWDLLQNRAGGIGGAPANETNTRRDKLGINQVRVVRQEAVGMYEVAVLEAGSAGALKKWLDDHGYRYPDGMEKPCNEYVKHQWCFVAIKTKVGPKSGVDPKPGQRRVDPKLPAGATFDGNVQAMGFRFRSDRLVVPMRLSAFNAGRLHNIVYLLTDGPKRVRSIPEEYVVRQIPGEDLIRNTTDPLPLRIVGGTEDQLEKWQRDALPKQRDPAPHNGSARELFAADMEAISHDRLANQYEEQEKVLLSIGERLGLRGAQIDKLHGAALADDRKKESDAALAKLKGMTLTVIDGDFPREVIARQNLAFDDYRMPARRNRAEVYDAIQKGPTGKKEGIRKLGALSTPGESGGNAKVIAAATSVGPAAAGVLAVTILGFVLGRRRPARRRA